MPEASCINTEGSFICICPNGRIASTGVTQVSFLYDTGPTRPSCLTTLAYRGEVCFVSLLREPQLHLGCVTTPHATWVVAAWFLPATRAYGCIMSTDPDAGRLVTREIEAALVTLAEQLQCTELSGECLLMQCELCTRGFSTEGVCHPCPAGTWQENQTRGASVRWACMLTSANFWRFNTTTLP
eukprot:3749756-Rhodomonas_salina.1